MRIVLVLPKSCPSNTGQEHVKNAAGLNLTALSEIIATDWSCKSTQARLLVDTSKNLHIRAAVRASDVFIVYWEM